MFFETLRRLPRTLALRFTLWYAGVFAASSTLAFVFMYVLFISIVRERTDDDLEEDLGEFTVFMTEGGLDRVHSEIDLETQGSGGDEVFYHLWGPAGGMVIDAGVSTSRAGAPSADGGEPELETVEVSGAEHHFRVARGAIAPGYVMEIGQSLEADDEFIAAFRNGFLVTLAVVLLLAAPIGWFLARRALRPVEALTRTATAITQGALDRRVPVKPGEDELSVLTRTFNTMLDRIQALIVAMREMTDNLAHDLRSPLARIRASSEMAIGDAKSPPQWESMAGSTIEECDRLMEMIDTTLDIAEAESGAVRLRMEEIDLAALVHDACDVFRSVAEDRDITLLAEVKAPCVVLGDRQRLQRVVANLLDNAIKYTPSQGQVTLRVLEEGERVKLVIQDTGIGISPEELPRIFQRFYRSDRSRSGNGNGLGLSLALAFVRAHGGEILAESGPGGGSTFTVLLTRPKKS